jgi:AmmeMemoRadiSam system protein A
MLMLSDTELGPLLLGRAREAITQRLHDGSTLAGDPRLDGPGATFVTLTRDGDLRGCVGSVRAQRPLGEDVATNAVGAATRDTRFAPVTRAELNDLRVEVSLLSDPQFLEFASEDELLQQLRPEVDGLMLFAGCRSAVFLPQVWTQLREPSLFLAALKEKAGLTAGRSADTLMAAAFTVRKWKE